MNRKKIISVILTLLLLLACVTACQAASPGQTTDPETSQAEEMTGNEMQSEPDPAAGEETMIYAHIGDKTLTIKPESNSSARAFVELLQSGGLTVDMHDYGGFEKVGPLGTTLPTNDERITTEPGDVILYQGNQITIYYDTNTWSFTRLGKVQGMAPEEIRDALGNGDPTVVFSLKDGQESTGAVGKFDFENRTVLLNSGYTMPILGLGTYALDHDSCVNSVKALLQNGGRLIDTANQFSDPEAAIEMALEKLDIGYIDMMLLHHPGTDDVKAYKAMETYVAQGKIRSLGLSNWYVEELTDFLPQITIMPALVQNEIHPYYQEQDVVPFIQEKGIVVQCWYPLGGRGHTADLLGDETIRSIAEAHGVSSAQVILRWDLQRGIVVIPGSSNPEHIKENLDLFGFSLTDEEMAAISNLDRNEKHDWY